MTTATTMPAMGPSVDQSEYSDGEIRPSWRRPELYVDPGHRSIFERTDNIPGWQMPGDTYKIYEMAHYCGDVILEIGTFRGRSAVVAVEGALSNPKRRSPCFFSIDISHGSVKRGYASLAARGLDRYGAFFLGGLGRFIEEFSISPTMVFVDGDHRYAGVKSDLALLAKYLQPGVPILCHDYLNTDNGKPEMGVRQAVDEWVRDGFGRLMGSFGCSALLITTDKCTGKSYDRPEASLVMLQSKTKRGPICVEGPRISRLGGTERAACSAYLAPAERAAAILMRGGNGRNDIGLRSVYSGGAYFACMQGPRTGNDHRRR
jgi:hypothetical protein